MERVDVEKWFRVHPPASRVEVKELLDRCESAVRRHAQEDAWLAARNYALQRAHEWEGEFGLAASEQFVTGEVCHELSWELAHHEPMVQPGAEDHLVGGSVRQALAPDEWEMIRPWVLGQAAAEEHRTWMEIVKFTNGRAREIVRRNRFTLDSGWDAAHQYTAIAAHVAQILSREYSLRAHPR
ncbi:MAG TPA: hypothetical protein VMS55_00505 [Myxococcota bacterium]|nr:hypothetical protein [Myxococcota bacterium]